MAEGRAHFLYPVELELLPVPITAEKVRDDAVEEHRTPPKMPGKPVAPGELLWNIPDLTLDGKAIHLEGGSPSATCLTMRPLRRRRPGWKAP